MNARAVKKYNFFPTECILSANMNNPFAAFHAEPKHNGVTDCKIQDNVSRNDLRDFSPLKLVFTVKIVRVLPNHTGFSSVSRLANMIILDGNP